MCVVSMIGDQAVKTWPPQYPDIWKDRVLPTDIDTLRNNTDAQRITELERQLRDLTREFEIFRGLITAGKQYDIDNEEPHCEQDEKVEILRKVAKLLGVEEIEL